MHTKSRYGLITSPGIHTALWASHVASSSSQEYQVGTWEITFLNTSLHNLGLYQCRHVPVGAKATYVAVLDCIKSSLHLLVKLGGEVLDSLIFWQKSQCWTVQLTQNPAQSKCIQPNELSAQMIFFVTCVHCTIHFHTIPPPHPKAWFESTFLPDPPELLLTTVHNLITISWK